MVESNCVEPQHERVSPTAIKVGISERDVHPAVRRIVTHFTTGAGARRLGTVEHIRLNFIALTASEDVVLQALVVMRFDDGKPQIAAACRTHHFRGNRAGRLLSKHGTPLPADLLGANSKGAPFTERLKSRSSNVVRSPCDSGSYRCKLVLMAGRGLYKIEHGPSFPRAKHPNAKRAHAA